jgi:hypothetical protein
MDCDRDGEIMDNKPGPKGDQDGVEIDYDHIDVAEIGERIKAAAAARSKPSSVEESSPAPLSPAPSGRGLKPRLKGMAARFLKPLFPLMRILALPVHQEVAAVVKSLDGTNRRIDELVPPSARSVEYIKLLHMFNHNLVIELTKLRIEHDALKSRLRLLEKDVEFLTRRERAVEERVFPE